MTIRRLFVFLCIFFLIGAVGALVLKHNEDEKVEYGDMLAGVLACVSTDKCMVPSTVETFGGMKIPGVYLKIPEKGINIKYAFINDGVSVVIIRDQEVQVSLNDFDLDGIIDVALVTEDGVVHRVGDPAFNDSMVDAQILYEDALRTAWDKLVPKGIKRALRDIRKEEKEEAVKKEQPQKPDYST